MTAMPAPGEDEWWNGLRWVDATHMHLARFEKVFWEHQGAIHAALTERFREKAQVGWSAILDSTGACMAAVVPLTVAPDHPHLAARGTVVERDGIVQPAPARWFSRRVPGHRRRAGAGHTARLSMAPEGPGARTREALTAWGIEDVEAPIDRDVDVEG